MKTAILLLGFVLMVILISPIQVLALSISQTPTIFALSFIEDWLGLPISIQTVQLWLIILVFSSSGGIFGIAMKHYQAKNWKLGWEDFCYYMLTFSISFLFLINASNTSPTMCFTIPAGLNGGLGILRNKYDTRKEGNATETK